MKKISFILFLVLLETPVLAWNTKPTNTPAPTPANTATPLNTWTSTATKTATNTPTHTPTQTATWTCTESRTNTATLTPRNTATKTATQTVTKTPTQTATRTFTLTRTVTATRTATNSPTNTATKTLTNTATQTATNTATNTNTNTPTNTATQTATNTATETPCADLSWYATPGGTADSDLGLILGTPMTISGSKTVYDVNGYMNTGGNGNIRGALYGGQADNSFPITLLAESASTASHTGRNSLPIGPVTIGAGVYWTCFQQSNASDMWVYDAMGGGVRLVSAQAYGAFPSTLAGASFSGSVFSFFSQFCP